MTRVGYFDRPEHAQRFDRLAPHPRLLAALGELLALRGTEQVLDVGTGTGRVAAHLLPMLPAGCIIGVDAAAAMLQQARSKQSAASRYRLVCGVAERLPIHGAAVDVALFACVLHHLEDPSAALRAAHGVLKADGRLVVLGPVVAEPVDELDLAVQRAVEGVFRHSHGSEFRFLTTLQAARFVEDAGFAIETARELVVPFENDELDRLPMSRYLHEAFVSLAQTPELHERFQARYLRFEGEPLRVSGRLFYAAIRAHRAKTAD